MFRVKVPFFWFSIPENLHVEARPNYIEFYEKLNKEPTQDKFQRILGTVILSGLAMYFFAEWQHGMANSTTPPNVCKPKINTNGIISRARNND